MLRPTFERGRRQDQSQRGPGDLFPRGGTNHGPVGRGCIGPVVAGVVVPPRGGISASGEKPSTFVGQPKVNPKNRPPMRLSAARYFSKQGMGALGFRAIFPAPASGLPVGRTPRQGPVVFVGRRAWPLDNGPRGQKISLRSVGADQTNEGGPPRPPVPPRGGKIATTVLGGPSRERGPEGPGWERR